MTEDLAALIAACAGGDDRAFADLHDRTVARVRSRVQWTVRAPEHAAEVTQDVYVEVWRHAARFDPARGSALTWMLTIAHRRAVDRVRSSQASVQRNDRYAEQALVRPYDQVSEEVLAAMEGQWVRDAVNRLPLDQRQALTLAYLDGHSHSQVADLLHIPIGTVKSRIRRGLQRLKPALVLDLGVV